MSIKAALSEISQEVQDILSTDFQFTISNTKSVPSFDDDDLTFEYGQTKRGKKIETCVLYVDIRNSTKISLQNKHQPELLGRLYIAFTKAMMKAAEFHGGKVRNIIGDRIMVVFPQEACFTSSVHCAITMNTVARDINRQFSGIDFKCGIGIDYGEMLVLKTGLYRRGEERNSTRNLIWLGQPANVASKLTDLANKELVESKVKVAYKAISALWQRFLSSPVLSTNRFPLLGSLPSPIPERETTVDEFVRELEWSGLDKKLKYKLGDLEGFERREVKTITSPILITEKVFDGYKVHNPNANDVKSGWWKTQAVKVPGFRGKVYGSGLLW